jgi:hypothetical protein
MVSRGMASLVLVMVFGHAARADEEPVEVHGFASQGALLSTDNNYLARSARGSLEFSEAGLNVSKQLDDRLRIGVQLFTHDLGPVGDYQARFDWFGLDYRWRDWLGMRAGRVKVPYGLYNDTSDVDAAHTVALLPQAIYNAGNRDALLAQTGIELYGYKFLGESGGALDYRAFGGTIYVDPTESATSSVGSIDVPYVVGGRLMWETPLDGLRFGASALALELDAQFTTQGVPEPIPLDLRIALWVASVEYHNGPMFFASEVAQWHSKLRSPIANLDQDDARGYGLAGYRVNPWLQLAGYYSIYYPNTDVREGRESRQYDGALTMRFDITPHWIVKLEGHDMRGTAALSPQLNANVPTSQLVNRWWLAVAKTTVYF